MARSDSTPDSSILFRTRLVKVCLYFSETMGVTIAVGQFLRVCLDRVRSRIHGEQRLPLGGPSKCAGCDDSTLFRYFYILFIYVNAILTPNLVLPSDGGQCDLCYRYLLLNLFRWHGILFNVNNLIRLGWQFRRGLIYVGICRHLITLSPLGLEGDYG